MKKILLLTILLIGLSINTARANSNECVNHQDESYREIIVGKWSIEPYQSEGTIQFYANGQLVVNSLIEGKCYGTWSLKSEILEINITQSKYEVGSFSGKILCANKSLIRIEWSKNDIQTLHRN